MEKQEIKNSNNFLEGKRLYLRPFRKTDIPVWFNWFNSQAITEHMTKGVFPNTELAQEEFFQSISKSKADIQLAIVLKKDDSLIGTIGIHKIDWIHRHGDISVVIGDTNHWGKGFATEAVSLIIKHAFTKLNLHKLNAGMWSSNLSSKKCFENNGFREEGKIRKQFFYKDLYVDEYRLGLLREEWEAKKCR
jgi:RimJ/RimL family protein N-acetyltransferase